MSPPVRDVAPAGDGLGRMGVLSLLITLMRSKCYSRICWSKHGHYCEHCSNVIYVASADPRNLLVLSAVKSEATYSNATELD